MNQDVKDLLKALLGGLGFLETLIAWILVLSAGGFAAFVLYLLVNILLMLPVWAFAFAAGMFVPFVRKQLLKLLK